MGVVGGPTSYSFIGPKIASGAPGPRNTLSCLINDCLLCIDPCSFLTLSINKALQMEPHVSCYDHSVTESLNTFTE